MRILVTGERGYLCSSICNYIENNLDSMNIINVTGDIRYINVTSQPEHDVILHFASPSDRVEFSDYTKLTTTIIDGTRNMVDVANTFNTKIIFASSIGVEIAPEVTDDLGQVIYGDCKRAMEHYIKNNCSQYIILRIPRVYSRCRKKGLIRQIRENTVPEADMNNIVEYITLQDFINQTLPVLNQTNVTHDYKITNKRKIGEIKQWVEK